MRFTTHQLQVERRESQRDNQVYALTTHQLQVERRERHRDNQVYAHTTHQLQGRGERVKETIQCLSVGGNLAQDTGYTPTLYEKSHGIFNDHRELFLKRPGFKYF